MKLLGRGSKYVKPIWGAFQLGWKSVIWFPGLHGKVERSRGSYTKNSWEKVAFWHRIMQMGHILQFSHDGLPLKPPSQAAAMLMREMHQWTVSSQGLPKGSGMRRGPEGVGGGRRKKGRKKWWWWGRGEGGENGGRAVELWIIRARAWKNKNNLAGSSGRCKMNSLKIISRQDFRDFKKQNRMGDRQLFKLPVGQKVILKLGAKMLLSRE